MEYFKVTDKAIGGDSYYLKFTPSNTSMNMTGKAEIARCVKTAAIDTNEEYYTYILEKHDLFDMNIVEIDYELDVNDWTQIQGYVDNKTLFNNSLQNFDPLVDKGITLFGHMISVVELKNKIREVEGEPVISVDMASNEKSDNATDLLKMLNSTLLGNAYATFKLPDSDEN